MLSRRFHLHGLFAVLLALMAQLGIGATVPRLDPIALITGVTGLCHADDSGGTPAPAHSTDCLVCPLCAAVHAPAGAPPSGTSIQIPPAVAGKRRADLPPPSTAPPAPHRPPSQPRAPPAYS